MSEYLRFEDRTVVVTGAGRGIGRAHARFFASRGANVVVADLDTATDGSSRSVGDAAEATAAEIARAGGSCVAVRADVSHPAGASSIVTTAADAYGGIDVVINNAGVITTGTVEDVTVDQLHKHISVHLVGSFLLAQEAWPLLKRSGEGRVINTLSPAMLGIPGMLAYGTSKAAVYGLTRSLAVEGAAHGIRAHAIIPGAATRMLDASAQAVAPDLIAQTRRAAAPEQVVPIVAYLAHPDSQHINGELFFVAGGAVARQAVVQSTGFFDAGHTPEDIVAHLDQIMTLENAAPQLLDVTKGE